MIQYVIESCVVQSLSVSSSLSVFYNKVYNPQTPNPLLPPCGTSCMISSMLAVSCTPCLFPSLSANSVSASLTAVQTYFLSRIPKAHHKRRAVAKWDDATVDVTKPQVRACYLCVAFTHPLSSPRLFLNQLPADVCTKYPANIKAQLQARGSLEHFTSLRTKDVSWDSVRAQVVKDSELPSSIVYPPPPKRRKERQGETSSTK